MYLRHEHDERTREQRENDREEPPEGVPGFIFDGVQFTVEYDPKQWDGDFAEPPEDAARGDELVIEAGDRVPRAAVARYYNGIGDLLIPVEENGRPVEHRAPEEINTDAARSALGIGKVAQ
jgi:hypothetical protein